MITVALDSNGADAARPWIERAKPSHPSLIDRRHIVADLYGIINVPMAVWIDEQGVVVRPAEVPSANRFMDALMGIGEHAYLDALRDWATNGAASRYVLPPEARRARQSLPDATDALAAANFRLAEYLVERGHPEAARLYFEEAKRLRPESWTYRRQTWNIFDPAQNYGRGWLEAVEALGDTPYYEPLRLDDAPADAAESARRQNAMLANLLQNIPRAE